MGQEGACMGAGGTNPSRHGRRWPCSGQPWWRLWAWLALGSPHSSAICPEGQRCSKPSVRAACHQTCWRRCLGMREIKEPFLSPRHPRTGPWEHPQLLVSDEESGFALFMRNWAWDQLGCGIRCVWQPWPLQLMSYVLPVAHMGWVVSSVTRL